MALFPLRLQINYEEEKNVLKEFLQNFKSSQSASEASATEAISGLNIDEDDLDALDEMDEDGEENGRTTRERREPKLKYMALLQEIADRTKNHIVIELDDLDKVQSDPGDGAYTLRLSVGRLIDAPLPVHEICTRRATFRPCRTDYK